MKNQTYNIPTVKCNIFYFDSENNDDLAKEIVDILKKYEFFSPTIIHADNLTNNKFVACDGDMEKIFLEAYVQPKINSVWISSLQNEADELYWDLNWNFTSYKLKKCKALTIHTWNILQFSATHKMFVKKGFANSFISCVKELIRILNPISAIIEDAEKCTEVLQKYQPFNPENIPAIFWGNYLAKKCILPEFANSCLESGIDLTQIGEGLFFTLTDNPLDYNTTKCMNLRRKLSKCVHNNKQVSKNLFSW